jgi:hypothetical protein
VFSIRSPTRRSTAMPDHGDGKRVVTASGDNTAPIL